MTLEIYCWRMPPCISFRCPQPRGPRHCHLHLCGGTQWPHCHCVGERGRDLHAGCPTCSWKPFLLSTSRDMFPLSIDRRCSPALGAMHASLSAPHSTCHASPAPLTLQVALCFGSGAAKVLFGQEPDVASLVGQYCWGLLPGMWPLVLGLVLMKYLQTQVRGGGWRKRRGGAGEGEPWRS